MSRPNLRTITVTIVALTLPITLLISTATTAYFKSTNPDKVDVTQGLAYLQQSLTASAITLGLLIAASITGIILMYRRDRDFSNAKLPLVLLITTCVILAGAGLLNGYVGKVQDQYLIDHGRPTMKQFFEELEKNDN